MTKSLLDMTFEKLWKLFPIILTKPNKNWSKWYIEEQKILTNLLSIKDIRISHISLNIVSTKN